MAVLRHPRDGVCPRCFAECCIVGHIVGDRREVCFKRAGLLIGLGCPANEGVRVLRIICFRRVGLIKAWLCVVFYVVIRLERGNTILRLPRDGMARHCDFTGGDGEGDLFRICAAADREGRFAVEGGVAVLCLYQIFVIRVDGDGVGFGVGVDGFLRAVGELLCFFCLVKRLRIEFPRSSSKFLLIRFRDLDAGGQRILDCAGVQAGDDGVGDGCESGVQLICVGSVVGELFFCASFGRCSDFILQIIANCDIAIVHVVIRYTKANRIDRCTVSQRGCCAFGGIIGFLVAAASIATDIIVLITNRNIFFL